MGKDYVKYSTELSDANKLPESLREIYPSNEIEKKINVLLPKVPAKKLEKSTETNPPVTESLTNPVTNSATDPEPDTTKWYKGKLVTYKYSNEKGTVKAEDGKEYPFELKSIKDESLQNQVKKIFSKTFEPIDVTFKLFKMVNKYVVSDMKRGTKSTKSESYALKQVDSDEPSISYANSLFTNKEYLSAIKIYKQHMNDVDWETAFSQIINCYLALSNENEVLGYLEDLRAFVENYVDKIPKNAKTLEVLQQFYNKINDNKKSVDVFNDLLDICKPTDYNKQLHYILGKKRCYRNMRDYPLAIGELKNWLDIVERNNTTNQYDNRDTFIYNELAELYFELEDYGNAEKYVSLSVDSDRSQSLKQKLEAKKAELTSEVAEETNDDGFDNDDDIIDEVVPEPEESLQSAYEEYIDVDGFDTLDKDDRDIIKIAFSFDKNHLYCLLTYLNSASAISASSKKTRTDDNGETVYVGQAIKAVDTAVAYAFNSPLVDLKYLSTEIIEAKISDQNLSSAEYIMGCILRGDVNAISDYSDEPFGYFAEFISEYATNSRAVRGASRNIADAIFEYSGKKDLEKALKVLTHNAFKETRGGANLLKNWIPKGGPANTELLDLLLTKLGFKPLSVSPDESVAFGEAYHVYCHKQIGRVNFVHNIPAFGSKSETEGFRVLCLYGNYNCDSLMDKFRLANSVAKHTLVLLDFALNIEDTDDLQERLKKRNHSPKHSLFLTELPFSTLQSIMPKTQFSKDFLLFHCHSHTISRLLKHQLRICRPNCLPAEKQSLIQLNHPKAQTLYMAADSSERVLC